MNKSTRCPPGNRHMRRILNQAANAAVKHDQKLIRGLI
ncbi:MAG: hypothetical protein JO108_01725 [Acidobacteriaceae bacterium]|nr:hypothetical protein [Acidobacteriaceae bacterium]